MRWMVPLFPCYRWGMEAKRGQILLVLFALKSTVLHEHSWWNHSLNNIAIRCEEGCHNGPGKIGWLDQGETRNVWERQIEQWSSNWDSGAFSAKPSCFLLGPINMIYSLPFSIVFCPVCIRYWLKLRPQRPTARVCGGVWALFWTLGILGSKLGRISSPFSLVTFALRMVWLSRSPSS